MGSPNVCESRHLHTQRQVSSLRTRHPCVVMPTMRGSSSPGPCSAPIESKHALRELMSVVSDSRLPRRERERERERERHETAGWRPRGIMTDTMPTAWLWKNGCAREEDGASSGPARACSGPAAYVRMQFAGHSVARSGAGSGTHTRSAHPRHTQTSYGEAGKGGSASLRSVPFS